VNGVFKPKEMMMDTDQDKILVLGGTGKTGRRVVQRLKACDVPFRIGSRAGKPPFDWGRPETWTPVLQGVRAIYVSYYPALAVPGAVEKIRAFTELAVQNGARRLVLLSGRGEEQARRCEQAVQDSGADWTLLRASWFNQNFSEGYLLDALRMGEVTLPAGDVPEPFIDAEDIADVAAAALVKDGHAGQLYELTGPRLLTFAEAVEDIARVTGREIRYRQVAVDEYAAMLTAHHVPAEFVRLLQYLFSTIMDGRNAYLADGVQRALGCGPREFSEFACEAAAAGVWKGIASAA
jgi:uncharacterized protein YbjT (DUF2867 family)